MRIPFNHPAFNGLKIYLDQSSVERLVGRQLINDAQCPAIVLTRSCSDDTELPPCRQLVKIPRDQQFMPRLKEQHVQRLIGQMQLALGILLHPPLDPSKK
ncbi:hypothetical protein A7X76_19635 [Stenotrophomonas maltophilia]|nr:hypothetical protein BB780_06885 [Stenotrophomonas maltophilia]PZS74733.1 hypothetical protein A7X76_19635 [Stenotrophomonas maltophilia]